MTAALVTAPLSAHMTDDQNQRIAAIVREQQSRLKAFIRRRISNPGDADDILQDVFSKLVEANRLLMPIDHVTAWLFRVARNRITDFFRKKTPELFSDIQPAAADDDEDAVPFEEWLPSNDADPDGRYLRARLVDELAAALRDLPGEQRDVFIAHEIDGLSFQEIAAETGVNLNTLRARKRYAVQRLRDRLQPIHDELTKS